MKQNTQKVVNFCCRDRQQFGWLSNFQDSAFFAGGKIWSTVGHFYQAMKTTSKTEREWVRTSKTPKEAKRRGKKVTIRPDWEDIKVEVMRWALKKKFSQNPWLKKKLIATGEAMLVEDAPWDPFWGTGAGSGKNMLGVLLMEVREIFLNLEKTP